MLITWEQRQICDTLFEIKKRMMDNAQKVNNCINIPSSQTFTSYLEVNMSYLLSPILLPPAVHLQHNYFLSIIHPSIHLFIPPFITIRTLFINCRDLETRSFWNVAINCGLSCWILMFSFLAFNPFQSPYAVSILGYFWRWILLLTIAAMWIN
jgi:hypothetical protein